MLVARSVAEAHLYLDLRGCSRADRRHRLVMRGDDLVAVYECTCEGAPAVFEFSIPEPEARAGRYGDAAPSTVIGPGEFLAWADRMAMSVPYETSGLTAEQRAEARRRMEVAAECVAEVLKFVPAGEERVPEPAFHSDADRAMLAAEPGRFRAARLQAVLDTYRALLSKLG